jgi:hypothetical protein
MRWPKGSDVAINTAPFSLSSVSVLEKLTGKKAQQAPHFSQMLRRFTGFRHCSFLTGQISMVRGGDADWVSDSAA